MKTKIRRVLLSSVLIAGIVFSTYGVFARAQANGRFASAPPKSPARGSAKAGSAAVPVSATGTVPTSDAVATGNSVPMMQASYSSMTDGNYVGAREYAYYGYVQVEVIVQNGKIQNVKVLEYPNDNGTSRYINSIAQPYLVQEAVQAQSANINYISGATLSSQAFVKSLDTAISKAQSA